LNKSGLESVWLQKRALTNDSQPNGMCFFSTKWHLSYVFAEKQNGVRTAGFWIFLNLLKPYNYYRTLSRQKFVSMTLSG